MSRWQKIIAVSICCACIVNAIAFNGAESVRQPVKNPKPIDNKCSTPECIHTASWLLANGKFGVNPCDDFYEFACGDMDLARTPWDQYRSEESMANDRLHVRLKNLIEGIDKTKAPKHFRLLWTLYDNCMHEEEKNIYSSKKLKDFRIYGNTTHGWPVLAGNRWNNTKFANKSKLLPNLLSIAYSADPENSIYNVPHLIVKDVRPGFEILRMGFDNDIVQAYYAFMVDTAVLIGAKRAQAEIELKEALLFTIDIARSVATKAKAWIFSESWIRTTVGKFAKRYPKFDVRSFIFSSTSAAYNLSDNDVIVVRCDFGKFVKVLSNVSGRVLSNWLGWLAVESAVPQLGPVFQARLERYDYFLSERAGKQSKWRPCVATVLSKLDLSLSALYQRKYMSKKIVKDLDDMVANMKQQLHQLVTEADWLDTEARQEYRQKIDNMTIQVSYRDEYVDDKKLKRFYKNVELVEGAMTESLRNISIGTMKATRRSWRSPIDRNSWLKIGNLLTNDAFYDALANHIFVGASLTLKNIYDIDRPKYINYGIIGARIAHEMGHLLSRTHVDKTLNVREWLSPEAKRKFDDRIQCIVDQYGNYTVEELGIKLDGRRLAMENAADNIGYKLAYRAYLNWAGQRRTEKELPGLPYTPKQMFWISLASSTCMKIEKSALRRWLAEATHPPPRHRINGAFASSPEFAIDFKCRPGTKMNPVKKCSVF